MHDLKKLFPLSGIFLLAVVLIFTVYQSSRPQGAFETRKKAADLETVQNIDQKQLESTPATASSTPISNRPVINFTLSLEKRTDKSIFVTIYGFDLNTTDKIDILGTTKTNDLGEGQITIPPSFSGKKLLLFAETPSHLRKQAINFSPLEIKEGNNPAEGVIDFGELIAGDVYMDETGYKNNLVDALDKETLSSAIKSMQEKGSITNLEWADLDGNKLVDSNDLAILSANLGKKGDYFPLAK